MTLAKKQDHNKPTENPDGPEFTQSDTYLSYFVKHETYEIHTDAWGAVADGDILVRYLPSDPDEAYYSTKQDILTAINDEIRPYIYTRLLVWAVVLIPVALGVLASLLAIGPQDPETATYALLSLVFTIWSSVGVYVYLAWYR